MTTNSELLRRTISKCTPGEGLELWEIGPYLEAIAAEYDKATRAQLPGDVESFLREVEARAVDFVAYYREYARVGGISESFVARVCAAPEQDVPRLVDIVREMVARIATENAWQQASKCANPETISAVIADLYERAECKPPLDGIPDGIDRIKAERDALRDRLATLEAGISVVAVALGNTGAKDANRIEDALTLLHGLQVKAECPELPRLRERLAKLEHDRINTLSAEPTVIVDTQGRVIRSPETEAQIAGLESRLAKLQAAIAPIHASCRNNILPLPRHLDAVDDALATAPTPPTQP